MLGVFLRHVCGIGCGAGVKFTDMGRDALVMKINFQQVLAGMNFYRLADAMMRDRVQVLIVLDVIIDSDLGRLDIDKLIGLFWQRIQRWPVQLLKPLPTATRPLLERLVVEFGQ